MPRKLDYIIERMGAHGWFAGVYPHSPERRLPTLYLIDDGRLIRRVWFVGFDDSPACEELRHEIIDWLWMTTKDMPI